ncbi:MAG: mannose-1-phosphate guanylyltransferase/mannose-6-phosphate isomerase [Alphaproteobacteria bacterium]|nr:mannose-1-phosphate guanylyltransferase/mannose-6-phosphate isomerase [Alphaproteobacteria bacterium]
MPTQTTIIKNIVPVILAGGNGSRLWPVSRPDLPKQFQAIVGTDTMFQQTVLRILEINFEQKPLVMTNQQHLSLVKKQLLEINALDIHLILEPTGRDTCPAILTAALCAVKRGAEMSILTIPSDHLIDKVSVIQNAITSDKLDRNSLVAFGISPNCASTAYGYIKTSAGNSDELRIIESFKEKPEEKLAKEYIEAGNYLWNSGMYLFPAELLISELRKLEPNMVKHCQAAIFLGNTRGNFLFLNDCSYQNANKISIDHALMEKTNKAKVFEIDPHWHDIGSWASVWECCEHDKSGNVKMGNVITSKAANSYIRSDGKLTAVLGVDNVIVIAMDDAVLVADKSESENLKQLVNKLKAEKCKEAVAHSNIERPWGNYKMIESGDNFQVKHITVYPGQKLSLQLHHHRAEHWAIVKGKAEVTVGQVEKIMGENEAVYIPVETMHRIANPFDEPIEFIEVQFGSYLGEDDIERFDDIYDRIA